ncbi:MULTISPECIES: PP2C family protein-serine/threonine phosphatase [unclassified Streptomyces]|uniref:PP2C family protein-serine/threonine phosphatase n=1 Tax=unclassified Streptomyces TaxID=2593676 RepID=UPI002250B58F|nr:MULTISPECIES: PP2C family protein-serine/threonine phosphatase [unclassified Streptomyces]MCX5053928.1 serine/threonine-protein phosphatase [Streptomyces sp. NBC_00474]MCX5060084.1 serine/threonine-protein phosphatase [Streptomyces sp. NBC_00452]MCX5252138.1 serine/threonine-protein phosphatase [Streptomyces sp. NBC_00201]
MTAKRTQRSHTVLTWLPVVVMAVVAVGDVLTGPGVGFLPLASLGPAFAGLVGGWRRTAWFGAAALLLCVALGLYDGLFQERRGFMAVVSVVGVTGASIAAAVMRRRREAELASVRSIAEVAQRVLLRPVPLTAGPLQAAVSYTSAVAEARIGGDLYEVVASPHGVRMIVGDVQGKGLAAVETAAVVLGAFREAAHDEPDLVGLGERLERSVSRVLEGEKFVTAVLAEVGPRHEVVFLNYGHPPPMVVREDGTADFPQPSAYALPLGLGLQGSGSPEPFSVGFAPGEQLLLYTDGVTEARDENGDFYPLGERAHLLKEADAQSALDTLREDLVRHAAGPPHDDAAMLLIRYHQHAPGESAGAAG